MGDRGYHGREKFAVSANDPVREEAAIMKPWSTTTTILRLF